MPARRNITRDIDADYDEHALTVSPREHEAAGVKAVTVSLQRGLKSMGAFRTAAALLRLNQRKGRKANFAVSPLQRVPVPPGRLILQTLRSHDQYNTTIYGLDDRYRGVRGGRRVVFVNPADVETFGLKDGDHVDLVSEFTNGDGELQERRAKGILVVAYSSPRGNAAAYYPETNALVALDHVADKSNTPVSKAIVIRLEGVSSSAA